jgi:hypothetical protein
VFRLGRNLILSGCLGLAACNNLPTRGDQPAVIARPTPESFEEVSAVLALALGPREILLAPDILTESSILALEQGGGAPRAATGRVVEMPERFELVLRGGSCYLVRVSTAERWVLRHTECTPRAP